jgi:hypothetical protein
MEAAVLARFDPWWSNLSFNHAKIMRGPETKRAAISPPLDHRSILDHSIKVTARHAAQYPVGPGNLTPAIPDANAHIIGPRASSGLGLRDTSIVAALVAVGAFCQTHPKSNSFRVRERRLLSGRERHAGRRRNPKHQQNQRYLVNVSHRGLFLAIGKITEEEIEQPASLCQWLLCFRPWPGFCAFPRQIDYMNFARVVREPGAGAVDYPVAGSIID